jgi:hypothetical protein
MHARWLLLTLILGATPGPPAWAADARGQIGAVSAPPVTRVAARPAHVIAARRTTLGIGYSAVRLTERTSTAGYYVHVVCTVGRGAFSRTYCPTPEHDAYCPSALIVCR